MKQSFASLPRPLRSSRASGSVVEACVALWRRSPWKSRSALRPPPAGGSAPGSALGLKLLRPANASISVPSTVKCSSDNNALTCGWLSTAWKNLAAIAPSSSRSRFLVNTVTSHTGSSIARPVNQRNGRL